MNMKRTFVWAGCQELRGWEVDGGRGAAGGGVVVPLRSFRLACRTCKRAEFNPAKSGEVFEALGFDLEFINRIFPGCVLERGTSAAATASAVSR